jgi:hypothetical protein
MLCMKYVYLAEHWKHHANLQPSCQWDVDGGSTAGIDAGNIVLVSILLLELNFIQALVHMGCIVLRLGRFAVQERINRKYHSAQVPLVVYVLSCLGFLVTYRLRFATKASNSPISCTTSSGTMVHGKC